MSLTLYPYTYFTDQFKKKKELYEQADKKTLSFLAEKVSTEYADFIQKEGFCQYKDGLFSTINPLRYANIIKAFDLTPSRDIPLVASAFGDLFYFDGFSMNVLHVSFNEQGNIGGGDAVKYLFIFQLTDSDFHKNFLAKKTLFKKAVEKHGALKGGQCYGFTPLVPDGGAEKAENIQVMDRLDYLAALGKAF